MPDRVPLPPSVVGDLPPPSAELTLIGAHMRAHMATLPPKKRRVYLRKLVGVLEEYEATSNVIRLRPRAFDADVTQARRGATAWTRGMLAAFFVLDADAPE